MHEAQLHPASCFVTLTYAPEHLPMHGSLCYEDFRLFMKRLRNANGPTRFYMCGEYGENLSRPHYHALLFGYWPDDYRVHGTGPIPLFTSEKLSKLWGKGFATFGHVTSESAGYVANYIHKKRTGPPAQDHYTRVTLDGEIVQVTPEFSNMSRKPGIGADWFAKYGQFVKDWDFIVLNGRKFKTPRYYDDLVETSDPIRAEEIEYERYQRSEAFIGENTRERLVVREAVATAAVRSKTRKLEQ